MTNEIHIPLKDWTPEVFKRTYEKGDKVDKAFETLEKILEGKASVTFDTGGTLYSGKEEGVEEILTIRRVSPDVIVAEPRAFIGRYYYRQSRPAVSVVFDIRYRFGDDILYHMVARASGFDDFIIINPETESDDKSPDTLVLYLLSLQYILQMEKAAALGLPRRYRRVEYHDHRIHGQIDMPRFIRKDIPFLGKISSVRYERRDVEELALLFDTAFKVVERVDRRLVNERTFGIRDYLRSSVRPRYMDTHTLEKAKRSPVLQNPLFALFKSAADTAALLVRYDHQKNGKLPQQSMLFDVSMMWENYIYALIREKLTRDKALNGWKVYHEPELFVYEKCFFNRYIIPDIVLVNEVEGVKDKVLVLDAKSKRMTCRGGSENDMGDLDREDFFQIHTYMSYYEKRGYEVLGGGLVYPIDKDCEEKSCSWFGGNEGDFFVEGVVLSGVQDVEKEAKKVVKLFCSDRECKDNTTRIKQINGRGIPKQCLKRIINYWNRCDTFDEQRLNDKCGADGCDKGEPCLEEERLENLLYARLKERSIDKYSNNKDKDGDGYRNRLLIKEAVYAIAKCKHAKMIARAEEEFFKRIKEKLTGN